MEQNKKKILFACYGLGIGGIEKCLVNLINILPEEEFDIDLLIMNPEYDMQPQIRRNVNYVDAFRYTLNTEFTMQEIRKRGGLWKHREKILPYIDHRIRIKLGLPLWTTFQPLEERYDIAIAYSQNGLAPYYVMDKVTADRKVLWYHNGAYEKSAKEYALDQKYYLAFDYVVAVSDACADVLREKFCFREGQLVVLYNICDVPGILEGSKEFVPESFEKKVFHITTVGRMSIEKGADLALEACRILCERRKNICWHWVGDGNMAAGIRKQVTQMGLQNHFILEGNHTNPYPYIRCADLYVQPSRYESYSMTTMEAKILSKPIIITGVGGMKRLINHGKNGFVVSADAAAIAAAVLELMDDPAARAAFSAQLDEEVYSAEGILQHYKEQVLR